MFLVSSGFMVGSHEARLAHVRSGHLAPNPGFFLFFFLIKFNILVGSMSNFSKS